MLEEDVILGVKDGVGVMDGDGVIDALGVTEILGVTLGLVDGVLLGVNDILGVTLGLVDGVLLGVNDILGVTLGLVDGVLLGVNDILGVTLGVVEGVLLGVTLGVLDGDADDVEDGEAVANGAARLTKTLLVDAFTDLDLPAISVPIPKTKFLIKLLLSIID